MGNLDVNVPIRFDVLLFCSRPVAGFTADCSAGVGTPTEVLEWGTPTIEAMRCRTWGTTLQRCVGGGQKESHSFIWVC